MKLIPTKVHGIIDYMTVATFLILPRALGWDERTTMLLTILGVGALAYSLVTRYELGAFKVLPMTGHLALDFMSGALLCIAPFTFLQTDSTEQMALIALGLFEIMAAVLTKTQPALSGATESQGT